METYASGLFTKNLMNFNPLWLYIFKVNVFCSPSEGELCNVGVVIEV